jgi:hypothetical protein
VKSPQKFLELLKAAAAGRRPELPKAVQFAAKMIPRGQLQQIAAEDPDKIDGEMLTIAFGALDIRSDDADPVSVVWLDDNGELVFRVFGDEKKVVDAHFAKLVGEPDPPGV